MVGGITEARNPPERPLPVFSTTLSRKPILTSDESLLVSTHFLQHLWGVSGRCYQNALGYFYNILQDCDFLSIFLSQ